jgi:hypothetical protein
MSAIIIRRFNHSFPFVPFHSLLIPFGPNCAQLLPARVVATLVIITEKFRIKFVTQDAISNNNIFAKNLERFKKSQ